MKRMTQTSNTWFDVLKQLDQTVIVIFILLSTLGIVMVTSASIGMAEKNLGNAFYYGERQLLRVLLGVVLIFIACKIPTKFWQDNSMLLMLLALFLLVLVLIPSVGKTVNGSTRWIDFGLFTVQVSEVARLLLIMYLCSYLTRRSEEVKMNTMGFVKPMIIMGLASGLLLLEPDFGAATVLLITGLGLLFLGGVRFGQFSLFVFGTGIILVLMVTTSDYRMERVTAFLNPWADPFDSGFQLTQALIAIGSGGWTGVGLGSSVQKLFYLPEAHTDFLYAIVAEELGFIGSVLIIGLFVWFLIRCFSIARQAQLKDQYFGGFLVYGVALLVSSQALINIGVNLGALPTKGLTLPLMSYGGNSILITSFAIGLVLRVWIEINAEPKKSVRRMRKEPELSADKEVLADG